MPVGLARLANGRIEFLNRKFTEAFGYRVGDFQSIQDYIEHTLLVPEHRARMGSVWLAALSERKSRERQIDEIEVDLLCKNGSIKTVLVSGATLPDAGWAIATFIDVTERKRNEILARQMAEEDPLTGLPNRRLFDAQLDRLLEDAARDKTTLHVLMLDLDRFKDVNDRFGHQAGDALLRETGQRLRASVRRSDIVARLGGDEFGVILPNSGTATDVDAICSKIVETIGRPATVEGHKVAIGISIGIAWFPADAYDAYGLMRAADGALYAVKKSARGTWRYAGA